MFYVLAVIGWALTVFVGLVFFVIDHQGIHLGQRTQLARQCHPIGRGVLLAPVIDRRFDVRDVNASHKVFEEGSES